MLPLVGNSALSSVANFNCMTCGLSYSSDMWVTVHISLHTLCNNPAVRNAAVGASCVAPMIFIINYPLSSITSNIQVMHAVCVGYLL